MYHIQNILAVSFHWLSGINNLATTESVKSTIVTNEQRHSIHWTNHKAWKNKGKGETIFRTLYQRHSFKKRHMLPSSHWKTNTNEAKVLVLGRCTRNVMRYVNKGLHPGLLKSVQLNRNITYNVQYLNNRTE